jgi:hypothetical protein
MLPLEDPVRFRRLNGCVHDRRTRIDDAIGDCSSELTSSHLVARANSAIKRGALNHRKPDEG